MIAPGVLLAVLLASGPNGLQVLHSPSAEQARQEYLLDRLGDVEPLPPQARKAYAPPTEAEKRAAAWRADHLTCASRKGRSREQFEAECRSVLNR
ncbi:MAG: hypothetical protein ACJ798_10705 [Phenylobacterium sp.]